MGGVKEGRSAGKKGKIKINCICFLPANLNDITYISFQMLYQFICRAEFLFSLNVI